jgi:hypothetical protein
MLVHQGPGGVARGRGEDAWINQTPIGSRRRIVNRLSWLVQCHVKYHLRIRQAKEILVSQTELKVGKVVRALLAGQK